MNRKITVLVVTKIALIIILMVNTTTIQAAERTWNAGEIYFYGDSYKSKNVFKSNIADIQDTRNYEDTNQFSYNITAVDLLSERYEAIYDDTSGPYSESSYRFVWEDFAEYYLDLNNIFLFTYSWDHEHNTTVLTGFDFWLNNWKFIEPQWDMINQEFAAMFNTTEIIAAVADPYLPIIHNITFGEFLNNTNSYSIMGKNNLQDGKAKFSEKITSWTFSFDISNAFMIGDYNTTLGYDLYHSSKKATYSFEMGYTDGGILENLLANVALSYNSSIRSLETTMEYKLALGGIASLEGNFPIFVLIPAIFVAFFIPIKLRKEKSKENR